MQPLSWKGYEYTHYERSTDWFWTLGLVVLVGAGFSIYEGDVLFGIFILIAGIVLAFYALRKPQEVTYTLSDKGISFNSKLITKLQIKEFWIAEKDEGDHVLLLNLDQNSFPRLSVFVPRTIDLDTLRIGLTALAPENPIRESASEKIFALLGL